LSIHLIRGLQKYIASEQPQQYLFNGTSASLSRDFDSRYSQRGVQWVITSIAKQAGITKEVHTHTLRHCYATHLLEDGINIVTLKDLPGHQSIETTMEYLHVCQLENLQSFSPLDTLFAQCAPQPRQPLLLNCWAGMQKNWD
jgi:integrase/recombinase XerD